MELETAVAAVELLQRELAAAEASKAMVVASDLKEVRIPAAQERAMKALDELNDIELQSAGGVDIEKLKAVESRAQAHALAQ